MDQTKQKTAIAEYCGTDIYIDDELSERIPDYPNDLNAMFEAEKILTPKETEVYVLILLDMMQIPHAFRNLTRTYYLVMHATAEQRTEAFLKTIGKWEENS